MNIIIWLGFIIKNFNDFFHRDLEKATNDSVECGLCRLIARAGKIEIHHWSGKNFAPSDTIVPKAGLGGCSPKPTKLRDAPVRITQPISRVILVKIGPKQLGNISLKIICHLLAPNNSADFTSVYAIHFLTEAKAKGLPVPVDMLDKGVD